MINCTYLPADLVGVAIDKMKEGIIEIRPGIPCLDLGEKKYGMAEIGVIDADHYVKGMAVYSDNIPDAYHIMCYIRPNIKGVYKLIRTYDKKPREKRKILNLVTDETNPWKELEEDNEVKLAYEFLKDRKEV